MTDEAQPEIPDDKASPAQASEAAGVLTSNAPAVRGTDHVRDDVVARAPTPPPSPRTRSGVSSQPATDHNLAGVRVRGLTKHFGEIEAVTGVTVDVPTGAVFGLLGPDGAGKSTLIRMLATVLLPDAGEAEIFGISAAHSPDQLAPRIGYMSQRFSMYPDLSVAENLEFFARVRGVPRTRRRERAAELLQSMGLAPFAKRQARLLSGGMKQKLMLASTLMHDPDLLLLDEPTTGVDPVSRREFWRILAGIHAEGRTVLVATPYMDEAERCSHVGFMDAGRITHSGTPQELKDAVPGTLLEITAPDPRAVLAVLRDQPGVTQAHLLGNTIRVLLAYHPDETPEFVSGEVVRSRADTRDDGGEETGHTTVHDDGGEDPSPTTVHINPPSSTTVIPDDKGSDAKADEAAGVLTSNAPAVRGTDSIRDLLPATADVRPIAMDMESVFAYLAEQVPA